MGLLVQMAYTAVVLLIGCLIPSKTLGEEFTTKMHPILLTDARGVARARERVSRYEWAKLLVQKLSESASWLESEPLPAFDKSWWEEARKKPWQSIYPEVNYHTMLAIADPIRRAFDAAIVYSATGNLHYAELVRRVLLHYTSYEFFAVHPDCGLNWSVWGFQALQAYDLVYETIAPDDRARIDDFFARALKAIRENDEWWLRDMMGGLYNNHFAWHKLFIGAYGLFYGKRELVDYAINSDQGIRDLIENGTRDDGLWFESGLNYHFTAVTAMVHLAVALENAGCPPDLWHCRFANGRSLRDLVFGPIQTLYPDLTIPTIGDTYGKRLSLTSIDWYYCAYDAYKAPEIAWLLSMREDVAPEALFLEVLPACLTSSHVDLERNVRSPAMQTRIWPEHGYVALRSEEGTDYWRGRGFSAFVSFDADLIHSHRDKFNLTAFADGVHVAVDAEARATSGHAFSSTVQSELNRSSICHNTVMVDGMDHRPIGRKLELVEFVNAPEVKLATIADLQGIVYPGVRMMRTVAVTRDFLLDVFQVASDTEHIYDYLFHTYSDSGSFEERGDYKPVDLGNKAPWKWLRDARSRTVSDDWSVTAKQGGVNVRLTMLGGQATEVITCSFPRDDLFSSPAIPMLMARRKGRSTTYVAVLQTYGEAASDLKVFIEQDRHHKLRVRARVGNDRWEFCVKKLE